MNIASMALSRRYPRTLSVTPSPIDTPPPPLTKVRQLKPGEIKAHLFVVGMVIWESCIHSIPGWHGGFGEFVDGMAFGNWSLAARRHSRIFLSGPDHPYRFLNGDDAPVARNISTENLIFPF